MQAYIVEKITKDLELKSLLIASPTIAVLKFAEWVKKMPEKGDLQIAFRDANVTVAYVATPHMAIPQWALVKFPAGGTPVVEFYAHELDEEWRKKKLEDLRTNMFAGGTRAAYFFNVETLGIAEGFEKEEGDK